MASASLGSMIRGGRLHVAHTPILSVGVNQAIHIVFKNLPPVGRQVWLTRRSIVSLIGKGDGAWLGLRPGVVDSTGMTPMTIGARTTGILAPDSTVVEAHYLVGGIAPPSITTLLFTRITEPTTAMFQYPIHVPQESGLEIWIKPDKMMDIAAALYFVEMELSNMQTPYTPIDESEMVSAIDQE